ncbi:uncharacterized protein NECHADRAFT_97732 [Fusarium vanettenii 77-13-4]|uniref:FAD-binding domain-containing protein n=1 Tax=Fusarium vanettenii (strain ATCC MYA-4622 / CBS 123669 / FGSC 9596 / NRRL 45880 / 77-13-4) TaxID=660122 RepID=C7Z2H9_FUSV7|nr:uncharacterized protein NECHADRAFT_97732 [Fusarium vanettenii 77-13-4]EEU41664.1 hypothetical protein NECHADRAFT_97732 [Fusarium vanettenii 77-13-4]
MASSSPQPVLIIGAGISGLLLAQHLRQQGIPSRVFERDADLATRGAGWGLTLHWSLPALRSLLPGNLVDRLPEAYVDRSAVAEGLSSSFPFFDISTGELKASTPKAPESDRIRVTREGLRNILATNIEIEWEKQLAILSYGPDSVTATFEDGESATGRLLVACDGAQSIARHTLFPDNAETHKIPVRMLGVKLDLLQEQTKSLRELDPFFMQGTSSANDSFVYVSLLDTPGNHGDVFHPYVYQMCVSWPYREGFLDNPAPTEIPPTDDEKYKLIRRLAETWAEPFRTLALSVPEDAELKPLAPQDFPPPQDLRTPGRAILMGDAIHAMAMYRGEGANHVILDVADFVEKVLPALKESKGTEELRSALNEYEDAVVKRTRPGVLASRQACLDAHEWGRINNTSPLLTRREPQLALPEGY